jgi:hypothetical protein
MHENVDIPVTDLLLDSGNPRLKSEQPDQQQTALELMRQHGEHVLNLAEHIVDKTSLDPMARVAVVATGDRRKRYKVIEGNRRVLALKALETPSFVSAALSPKQSRKLAALSRKFADAPVEEVECVLFSSEDEAAPWIRLRHTGQNEGRGLVAWDPNEQDRFEARRTGVRKPAGQVLDFVEKHGNLSPEARASSKGVLTNIERLLSSPEARQRVGVDVVRGQVLALYPLEELTNSLTRIIEDFKTGAVSVPQLYHVEDRINYVKGLPRSARPKKSARLPEPLVLDDLTEGRRKPRSKAKAKPRKPPKVKQRTTVIPAGAKLNVTPPRTNAIYNELGEITVEQYPNACSVLLRVFLELSVDHYIEDHQLMTEKEISSTPLAKRLKRVAEHMHGSRRITVKLRKAIEQIANGPSVLAPGVSTFNQYVHNQHVFPKARDLYLAWDELEPLMEAMWP